MDFEQTDQASRTSCSDSEEANATSRPYETLEDAVGDPEQSDGSFDISAATVTQNSGSQTASLDDSSYTTNTDTNQKSITLTDGLENCSHSVDGKLDKLENASEDVHLTPNMLDSAYIEPRSSISHVPPSESLPGTPGVYTTIEIHTDEESSTSPDDPSDILANLYGDFEVPSSSPPTSSPLTSDYFRSSSPIPMTSSPYGYDLTPPTSPVKISNAGAEPASIQSDAFKEVPDVDPEESGEHVENVPATEPTTSDLMSLLPALKDDAYLADHGITPHDKVHQRLIPGPKRATLAGQKVRLQKLSRPFRPPAVQKPIAIVNQEDAMPSGHDNAANKPVAHTSLFAQKIQEKMKHRTAKAAAQFKSPLGSSSTGEEERLVRPTATIQALERKHQLLKRAVKVKEESEEEVLSGLIQKWTEAGREIAWEVWGLVKDKVDVGSKRQTEDSWGWQDGDAKRAKTDERLWGWDVIPVSEREEQEARRHTMGAMLVEMGVAATMGWDADEERFGE